MKKNFKVSYVGVNPYYRLSSHIIHQIGYYENIYQMAVNEAFDYYDKQSEDFVNARIEELNQKIGCFGEIVRVSDVVGYQKYYLNVIENCISHSDIFKRVLLNMGKENYNGCRYAVICVNGNHNSYVYGVDSYEDAKSFVFNKTNPLTDNCDYDSIYYIRDMEKDEYHKCEMSFEEDMTNISTEQSNATQIILPMYRYVAYGHI